MSKKKPIVLVVDDDPNFLDLCRARLSQDFDVHLAFDGDEGIHMALAYKPDAILLDLRMPRISGYQVLEHMQAQKEFRSIPVLVLTTLRLDEKQKASVLSMANVTRFLEKATALKGLAAETQLAVIMGRLHKATLTYKDWGPILNPPTHPRPA